MLSRKGGDKHEGTLGPDFLVRGDTLWVRFPGGPEEVEKNIFQRPVLVLYRASYIGDVVGTSEPTVFFIPSENMASEDSDRLSNLANALEPSKMSIWGKYPTPSAPSRRMFSSTGMSESEERTQLIAAAAVR